MAKVKSTLLILSDNQRLELTEQHANYRWNHQPGEQHKLLIKLQILQLLINLNIPSEKYIEKQYLGWRSTHGKHVKYQLMDPIKNLIYWPFKIKQKVSDFNYDS